MCVQELKKEMASKQISNLFSNQNENSIENSDEKKNFALKMLFAKHILKELPEIVKEKCFGCQVDHPSQLQHDVCLMMTKAEKIEVCFDTALEQVNYVDIYGEFLALFYNDLQDSNTTTVEIHDNEE